MINTNGIVSFEIEGVNYTLYFGMRAVIIFEQKCQEKTIKLNGGSLVDENGNAKEKLVYIDVLDMFVYCVYAGLCNEADRRDDVYPDFNFAYEIANKIISDKDTELQNKIWHSFKGSRAGAEYFNRLNELTNVNVEPEQKKKKTEAV